MDNLNSGFYTSTNYPVQEEDKMTPVQKIAGVIFSPGKVAKSIAAKPGILIPLILVLIASLGSVVFLLLNYDAYKEYTISMQKQIYENMGMNVTRQQMEAAFSMNAIIGFISAPIMAVGGWLIGTLILFGVVRMFKGEGKIKHYISVTGSAYVIGIIALIVMSAITYFTGNFGNSSITSLATLIPESMKGTFLFTFAATLEVFSIWQYSVVAIGVAEVSRLSKAKAYSIVAGLFLINALLTAGLGSLGSLFTK